MHGVDAYPGVRKEPFETLAEYERWREEGPVKLVRRANGEDTWLVLQQEAAQEILGQTDRLTSDMTAPGFPLFRAGKPSGNPGNMLPRMDPPKHAEVRRYFASFFTAKRIANWQPEIDRITESAFDHLLEVGPPADLMADFANRIPASVTCMLLGIDDAVTADFRRLAEGNASSLVSAEERNAAIAELYEIIEGIFAEQRKSPTEGIVSELVRWVDEGKLSHEAAVGNVFVLAVGSQETTAFTIGLGALQLMKRPDLVQKINEDPGKLPVLVEEMVRTQAIAGQVICRAVTKPISVGDQILEPGDGLAVVPEVANRDPRVYVNANEIDLDRDMSVGHVGFGSGIHSCLGMNLARAELRSVFARLFQKLPNLTIASGDEPEYRFDPFIFGVNRLPVEW
ncbi:cytochrome P450 [Nocardioides sp. NPDC051685]|uniref:cytochrome P450 n=1 Tax=Nocardioides sp. NPDC051685 TaxID=3364334 RepID=UPI00378C6EEF